MQTGSEAPAQVAAIALDLGTGAVRDIEPIKHGLTNRSWLVTTDGDRVVVRISDASAEELQIDRNSDLECVRCSHERKHRSDRRPVASTARARSSCQRTNCGSCRNGTWLPPHVG
jgi:hypothetical protein